MSLLSTTGSTDTAVVILRTGERNPRGEVIYRETGRVLMSGRLQPSTSADVERLQGTGVAVTEVVRFITDGSDFPGDHNSLVEVDGKRYRLVGTPERRKASRMTSRCILRLTAENQQDRW